MNLIYADEAHQYVKDFTVIVCNYKKNNNVQTAELKTSKIRNSRENCLHLLSKADFRLYSGFCTDGSLSQATVPKSALFCGQ